MSKTASACKLARQSKHSSQLNAWVSTRDSLGGNIDHYEASVKTKTRASERNPARLLAVKDNICTTGEPTTCGSGMLQGFHSPFAATVVQKLEAAGIVIAGKTNLDEFGMGSDSINSVRGPVRNWYTRDNDFISAGGSSGGSAVAVATHQCHEALGTDTGGSVRLPAAYTGVVGFKPSYGLVSRWGVVPYANSLDTVGILGNRTENVREIFDIINGHDARDPTSIKHITRERRRLQNAQRNSAYQYAADECASLRIGVPKEYNTEELHPSVRQAWTDTLKKLQAEGHSIHPISLPTTRLALSAYYIIAPAEASSNLAKYDGVRYGLSSNKNEHQRNGNVLYSARRGANFCEEVKRRILLGSYSLSAAAINNYFIKAQKIRRLVQSDFDRVFDLRNPLLRNDEQAFHNDIDKVDVIISPTTQSIAPKWKHIVERDPVDSYSADVLTVPASLAGLPAISIPVSNPNSDEDHGPIGMQVTGQYGDEDTVFAAAMAIERSNNNAAQYLGTQDL